MTDRFRDYMQSQEGEERRMEQELIEARKHVNCANERTRELVKETERKAKEAIEEIRHQKQKELDQFRS